jgi:hypothetical protein
MITAVRRTMKGCRFDKQWPNFDFLCEILGVLCAYQMELQEDKTDGVAEKY